MYFEEKDNIFERKRVLELILSAISTNIDSTSLSNLNEIYLICLKEVNEEKEVTKNTFEIILNEMIEGYGFNKKTKKEELYTSLNKKLRGLNIVIEDYLRKKFKKVVDSNQNSMSISDFDLLLNTLLIGTILKFIERFKDLLPMKRCSKSFKENYILLSQAREIYLDHKEKEESEKEENEYIKLPNNNGISEVIEQSPLINKKDIEREKDGCFNLEVTTSKGKIALDIKQGQTSREVITLKKNNSIGAAEQYLLIYIMQEVFKQLKPEDVKKGCNININVKEFCKLRNIPFRSEVGNEIIKSLKKLEKIIVEYEYTTVEKDEKGKKKVVQKRLKKSPLVLSSGMIETLEDDRKTVKNQSVGVAVGKWIETLNESQYQYRKKDCFRYNIKNTDDSTVSLSDYINNLHRNNLKNNLGKEKPFKTRVSNLTKLLGVNEDRIKSKGYTNVLKKPLERKLNDIKEKENFEWNYKNGNHKSRKEFEEDIIIFQNSNLDKYYQKKGFKSSTKNNK